MDRRKVLFIIEFVIFAAVSGYWLSSIFKPVQVQAQSVTAAATAAYCSAQKDNCFHNCSADQASNPSLCSCQAEHDCNTNCLNTEQRCLAGVLVMNSVGTSTSTSSTSTSKKMFLTASKYDGNLGGVTGADAKCQSDSNKPSTGTYKALLVDGENRVACTTANCSGGSSENKDWVLKANTSYVRTDGTAIGTTNAAGIFTSAFTNAVTSTTGVFYRSGLKINSTPGWVADASAHCQFYSVTTGTGTTGAAYGTNVSSGGGGDSFQYANASSCASTFVLLCVEQ